MDIQSVVGDILQQQVDGIVVNLFEGVTTPAGATGAVDKALGGLISAMIAKGQLSGKLGQTRTVFTACLPNATTVIVVGLGPRESFGPNEVRVAAAASIKAASDAKCKTVASIVHGAGIGGLDPSAAAQALAEGAVIGGYAYRELKCQPLPMDDSPACNVQRLVIVDHDSDKIGEIVAGIAKGRAIAEAANFARNLVNRPANVLGPEELAAAAKSLAIDARVSVDIFDRARLEREGLNLVLAVGQASARPPLMIALRYQGRPGDDIDLALVGKGLIFDSGGLQVKPSSSMIGMHGDMAGAAAMIGAARGIIALGVPINLLVVPVVENAISGNATRPSDVVKGYAGKTVEIAETDAEGRLILADGIAWAEAQGARRIIDAATLTGVCSSALGNSLTGLFCNDEPFADLIVSAGKDCGEQFCRLPLFEQYRRKMISRVADLKNHGGRSGSLINSALFLREFVKDAAWAHLDIAGTSTVEKPVLWFNSEGPTGVPVRTLVAVAERLAGGSC